MTYTTGSNTVLIPFFRPRSVLLTEDEKRRHIPYHLCFTAPSHELPPKFGKRILQLMERESKYDIYFFDDTESRKFIADNATQLPPGTLETLDNLIPGAYKADLFRYCFVYVMGGFYVDVNKEIVTSLDSVVFADLDLLLVKDKTGYNLPFHIDNNMIFQAFIASKAKMGIIRAVIEEVIHNNKNHFYGHTCLAPTGPYCFGQVFMKYYNQSNIVPKLHHLGNDIVKILRPFARQRWYVQDIDGKIVFRLKSLEDEAVINRFFKEKSQKLRYGDAWTQRRIYVDVGIAETNAFLWRRIITLFVIVLLLLVVAIFLRQEIQKSAPRRSRRD